MKRNRSDLLRGPRACWRTSNVAAPCKICGAYSATTHSPLHLAGFFCPTCCPACQPAAIDHEQLALTAVES